jgi:methionine-rich copper-binding protein CopC
MRKLTVSALVLSLSSVFLLSSPALAHNELIEQSPSADSVVEAGSIEIRLEYSEEPIPTEFGKGNLLAIANAETGEQLGAACATIDGKTMFTTVNIQDPGQYKVLWRSASDDGHIASGEYLITVENTTGYVSESIGNQCFDENGVELTLETQEPLTKVAESEFDLVAGLIWAGAFIAAGGALGAYLVLHRRSKKKI